MVTAGTSYRFLLSSRVRAGVKAVNYKTLTGQHRHLLPLSTAGLGCIISGSTEAEKSRMLYVLVFEPRMVILVCKIAGGCAALSVTWRESPLLGYLLCDLLWRLVKDRKWPVVLVFRFLTWRESLLL